MMRNTLAPALTTIVALIICRGYAAAQESRRSRPNVILILTDDQGYGEVAAHGNPIIKTPHMDKLHAASVRLTDFHVDPTCSPTRSALLTGRYSTRTGVWHTINGRSMIHPDELTLAETFKANGYRTAMIGKWHLGDNYPCRPEDQGFDHVIRHLGGGVGNGPDYWQNDYFDDTFKVDGKWRKFDGYCTDVWFREAAKFVDKTKDQPFFLYLATNAPHGPYYVDDKYAEPYEAAGVPKTMARFYGMIANIDENLGRFRARLDELGLTENTLLIFMTDNGTTAGWIDRKSPFKYYNAGMRGWKGSQWDGGHRVPCYFHWPAGGLKGGRDVDTLAAHIDLLPTLVDLLGLEKPKGRALDGVSLRPALFEHTKPMPERTLFAHVQRSFLPPKWTRSAAMTERWRLIDGKELYDIIADPGQKKNIAADHPEVVERLRGDYEKWWTSLAPALKQTVRYGLGGAENPTTLASHDWLMPGVEQAAWHQGHVERGSLINGAWAVDVERPGTYEIALYRWAPYLNKAMGVKEARLTLGKVDETIALKPDATRATFRVTLPKGPAMLQTWLRRPDGKQHGAYYTRVRCVPAASAMFPEARAELRTVSYNGREDCLELSNAVARLVIVPGSGGRIVHYSRDGGPNFFLGGCQIDIGPELDYPPSHPSLWTGRYKAEALGPLSVRLRSPKDKATGVQIVKVVELAPTGARVTLRQTISNVGAEEIAYCLWDRTMTGASHGFFELNPKSRFPARWSIRRGKHGTYRYDGESPGSPRVKIVHNLLVTVPGKKMEKVAADNVAGWIAGFRDGWLYVKRFPVDADGDYADGGNSVEIWVDAAGTRTEIEPLSPKVKLRPGESYSFVEHWDLRRVAEEIKSAEDIPKLLAHVREMARPPK